jgi:hypothetical protein
MKNYIVKIKNLVFLILLFNNQVVFSASAAAEVLDLGVKLGVGVIAGKALSKIFHGSSEVSLDDLSSEKYGNDQVVATMKCEGVDIQFAKGMRWTPPDFSPILDIGGKSIKLSAGCYATMSCVTYKQRPSVLVVSAPACGGNAVAEEYLVYDLKSKKRKVLNYNQAKKYVVPFE